MKRPTGQLSALLCLTFLSLTTTSTATADDWPQWGGPRRDLVWREEGIVKTLPTRGLLPRVWSTPIGEGYSGPSVANGRVYITDFVRAKRIERIHALDAETGKILLTRTYPVRYSISYPAGPRMTPVVEDDRVYTIGAMGDMFCLKVSDGTVVWKKNFVADYGTKLPIWGMVASPLIDGGQLITLVGGTDGSLVVSFDKLTGKEVWRSLTAKEPGYCPPTLIRAGGVEQLIIWHPESLNSLNPDTGEVYWSEPFRVRSGLSIPTPRQLGNRLFITAFYNGSMMMNLDPDKPGATLAWKSKRASEKNTKELHSIMPTPFFEDNHIYGVCSYGQLRCLRADTGERIWEDLTATRGGKEARWANAFLVKHEDRFFLFNELGNLLIARLTPSGYEELDKAHLIEPTGRAAGRDVVWSHPAFANRNVLVRNDKEIASFSLAE